jgi:hypothetical protein
MQPSCWTRWSVYEYMKHRYLRTGQVPSESELLEEFPEIGRMELDEGVAEFNSIVRDWSGGDAVCSSGE